VRVMGRDDVYPVRSSKVGCLLHYIAVGNRPWTSLLDIHVHHPDPVDATTVFSTPDDGRRKRPKHVE
jgi:hypothetical protein